MPPTPCLSSSIFKHSLFLITLRMEMRDKNQLDTFILGSAQHNPYRFAMEVISEKNLLVKASHFTASDPQTHSKLSLRLFVPIRCAIISFVNF